MAERIRKFVEDIGFGRVTNRVGYAADQSKLPPPIEGAHWREDPDFDEMLAIEKDSNMRAVLDHVHELGFATVERLV